MAAVQTVEHLIEKQQLWPGRQRTCQEHKAALAVRETEEAPVRQRFDAKALQEPRYFPAIRIAQGIQRNVGPIQTSANHLLDAVIPAIALVFVLPLRAEVGD